MGSEEDVFTLEISPSTQQYGTQHPGQYGPHHSEQQLAYCVPYNAPPSSETNGTAVESEPNHQYYSNTRPVKSIMPDLKKLAFSDDIRRRADAIFLAMDQGIRRGGRRKQLVAHCIYQAYKDLGIAVDPNFIATTVGINRNKIRKASSIFSPSRTGRHVPNTVTHPADLLPDYCKRIGLSEDASEQVCNIAVKICQLRRDLCEKSPRSVAAGILHYYMSIQGIQSNEALLREITTLSSATITSISALVSSIDNAWAKSF